MKQIINALFTILFTLVIYANEETYYLISLVFLIISATTIKNPFLPLTIIPLIYLNPTSFFILLSFYIVLTGNVYLIKHKLQYLTTILLSLVFYIILLYYTPLDAMIIILFPIWQMGILIAGLFLKRYPSITFELLNITIFISNFNHFNPLFFSILFIISILFTDLLYKPNFSLYTSFFIMIYAIYITNDFIYISLYITAHLVHFLFNHKKQNNYYTELIFQDIYANLTNFCSFMNDFANDNFDADGEKRLSVAIKILIESHCKSCKNRNTCFSNNKFKTYKYIKELLLNNHEHGYYTCIYYTDMVSQAKSLSIKYQLTKNVDKNQLQFNNLSLSLSHYFQALFERTTPKTLEILKFKQVMNTKKISDYEYKVFDDNHYSLTFNSPTLQKDELTLLTKNYFSNSKINRINNQFSISPKTQYHVSYEAATLSHNNYHLSGDNYFFKTLPEGMFVCALADGMGSGYEAYKLSSETLKMINRILKCSIDYETSLTILNNFFKLRDTDGAYSTLDFVNIDLLNGKMNLYKLGASTSYIIREEKIIQIYNNNLPFGINDLIIKEEYDLKNNDLVILFTDGVTDYISEEKLEQIILRLKNETPHRIVYEILQSIYYENQQKINDDTTCIALKINENGLSS